jgi:DNA-directed RNA polymerase specialized sigma24 family protein
MSRGQITEDQKRVIIRLSADGWGRGEIARRLGISRNSVIGFVFREGGEDFLRSVAESASLSPSDARYTRRLNRCLGWRVEWIAQALDAPEAAVRKAIGEPTH